MIERDWITKAGYRAVCVWNDRSGHRCGYVGVYPDHPLYRVHYQEETELLERLLAATNGEERPVGKRGIIPLFLFAMREEKEISPEIYFNVHGGITWSDGDTYGFPVKNSGLWWFGFDCGHAGDGNNFTLQIEPDAPVRSQKYVEAECESLAKQLKYVEIQKGLPDEISHPRPEATDP
jgi:hypothetical protein